MLIVFVDLCIHLNCIVWNLNVNLLQLYCKQHVVIIIKKISIQNKRNKNISGSVVTRTENIKNLIEFYHYYYLNGRREIIYVN